MNPNTPETDAALAELKAKTNALGATEIDLVEAVDTLVQSMAKLERGLASQNAELLQKLVTVEAANAQMRDALHCCDNEFKFTILHCGGPLHTVVKAALRTTAGTGWLSPEAAQKLRGEVVMAYNEGSYNQMVRKPYETSRAKRIAEGKDA